MRCVSRVLPLLALAFVGLSCGGSRDLPEPLVVAPPATTTVEPPPVPPTVEPSTTTTVPETIQPVDDNTRCTAAAQAVDEAGVHTAAGFELRCPADALDENGVPHWGITCYRWVGLCDESTAYIEINTDKIGRSDARLRYVIAHERCHSNEIAATGQTTEESADTCAEAIGFSRQAPAFDFIENLIYGVLGFIGIAAATVAIIRALRETPRRRKN